MKAPINNRKIQQVTQDTQGTNDKPNSKGPLERTPSAEETKVLTEGRGVEEDQLDPDKYFLTSNDYAEKFKNEMTDKEKKEAIRNLQVEISNDREALDGLKKMGEDHLIRSFEERINQKENQLKYLSSIAE